MNRGLLPDPALPSTRSPCLGALPASGRALDEKERDFYQKLALQEAWSARDLQAALRADLFGGGSLQDARIERLARIDAPESGTKAGRAAQSFVHKQLARTQTIAIRTEKIDLHGPYIGDLFLSPHQVPLDECYREGLHLNAALVEAGHAIVVE